MVIDRMFVLIIAASVVVFGDIKLSSADKPITLEKYEGVWYDIGRTPPCSSDHLYSCGKFEIKAQDYNVQTYNQVHYALESGDKLKQTYAYGRVVGDTIHVVYPDANKRGFIYAITAEFNNYENIIVKELLHGFDMLLSRHHSILNDTKTAFEKIAAHRRVVYFDQRNCQKMTK